MHIGLAFEILNRPNWQRGALVKLQELEARNPDLGEAEPFKRLLLVLEGKTQVT